MGASSAIIDPVRAVLQELDEAAESAVPDPKLEFDPEPRSNVS
jgi:hypothetical protein